MVERLETRELLSGASIMATAEAPRPTTAFDVIGVPDEQQRFSFRGQGINVAVIDSGADLAQPFIKGSVNMLDPAAPASDGFGHGTFIAAEIHEVAPLAGIYAVKVLDDQGNGPDGTIEAGIQWVIDHYQQDSISVVNFSIGYFQDDPTIDADFETLAKAGVTVCVAAGNWQATHPNVLNAAANCPDVISVGATWTQFLVNVNFDGATDYQTQTDKLAAYSNRADNLGILAPGDVHIDGQPKDWTGTSMSTALASGAAVLIHEALASQGKPTNEAAILAVMRATGVSVSDSPTPLDNVEHTGDTFKRLDVDAAIASIMPPAVPPKQSAPVPQPPTNATFIASLYEHVLGREAEPRGLAYWLGTGESHAAIASQIWESPEHLAHYIIETPEQLYESLLGRAGDTSGLAYFAGKPEDFTAVTMLASPEFFNESTN